MKNCDTFYDFKIIVYTILKLLSQLFIVMYDISLISPHHFQHLNMSVKVLNYRKGLLKHSVFSQINDFLKDDNDSMKFLGHKGRDNNFFMMSLYCQKWVSGYLKTILLFWAIFRKISLVAPNIDVKCMFYTKKRKLLDIFDTKIQHLLAF